MFCIYLNKFKKFLYNKKKLNVQFNYQKRFKKKNKNKKLKS